MDLKKTKLSPKLCIKQQLLYDNIKQFFRKENNGKMLLDIIAGRSKLSLRIIDWFVTNYSKKKSIILYRTIEKLKLVEDTKVNEDVIHKKTKKCRYENVKHTEQFNVYLKYKGQLKAYSKKHFDPFCRRNRINFFYNETDSIVTTIGQLNFFKWAISYKIIEYIENNLVEIENDMNKNIKRDDELELTKSKKKPVTDTKKRIRKKRRELSCAATNTLNKHKISITLDFE
jgi:hypothetical protein